MVLSRWMVVAVSVCLVFSFPQKARARQDGVVHYIVIDEDGREAWASLSANMTGADTPEERAAAVFNRMFSARYEEEGVGFIPENTALLGVRLADGSLTLNVSEDVRGYGGCYYERCLVRQIVKTALDIDGVNRVTLWIEGELTYLPEGTIVDGESDWGL